MDLPKEMRKVLEASQRNIKDVKAMPSTEWFDIQMLPVRDGLAKAAGVTPENVRLVGVKLFYSIKEVSDEHGAVIMIATQSRYHPDYGELLEASEEHAGNL